MDLELDKKLLRKNVDISLLCKNIMENFKGMIYILEYHDIEFIFFVYMSNPCHWVDLCVSQFTCTWT